MNLYDISDALLTTIEYGIDTETGEVLDGEALQRQIDGLKMELNDKLINIACFIKNLDAESEAIKNEKQKLAQRQKACENKAEWLRRYIDNYLKSVVGEDKINKFKLSDPRAVIGYRKSQAVNIKDEDAIPTEFRIPQPDKIDKTKIKDAIKAGKDVSGAEIITNVNLSIK